MKDAASVISTATEGIVEDLAKDREITKGRMYEILGKDNPYPKTKVLIRQIARHNQPGAKLIKADLDAMWAEIIDDDGHTSTVLDLHKEAFEAVNAILEKKAKSERVRELRELLVVVQDLLDAEDKEV